MINIDNYAYLSRLSSANPIEKFTMAMLTMATCLWADSISISVIVFLIMGGITVIKGGISLKFYLTLLSLPFGFLLLGIMSIAIELGSSGDNYLWSFSILGTVAGITKTGIFLALKLLFKAMGAVSCLYFLSLSTPIIDILSVLKKMRLPKLFIELMGLVYRFIFVLLETANSICTSQISRLGYRDFKTGYRSLSLLFSTLFYRAFKKSEDIYAALYARGYDGELNVIEEKTSVSFKNVTGIICINLVLIIFRIAI